LTPGTISDYFGSDNHEQIWNELNTQEDRRGRMIEWLETMITSNVSREIAEMNKRAQALKVQEAYRTSKGITMRRFINNQQSPQCQIHMQLVTEHFRETWS
jgi:3-dehydroquinate dehydratase